MGALIQQKTNNKRVNRPNSPFGEKSEKQENTSRKPCIQERLKAISDNRYSSGEESSEVFDAKSVIRKKRNLNESKDNHQKGIKSEKGTDSSHSNTKLDGNNFERTIKKGSHDGVEDVKISKKSCPIKAADMQRLQTYIKMADREDRRQKRENQKMNKIKHNTHPISSDKESKSECDNRTKTNMINQPSNHEKLNKDLKSSNTCPLTDQDQGQGQETNKKDRHLRAITTDLDKSTPVHRTESDVFNSKFLNDQTEKHTCEKTCEKSKSSTEKVIPIEIPSQIDASIKEKPQDRHDVIGVNGKDANICDVSDGNKCKAKLSKSDIPDKKKDKSSHHSDGKTDLCHKRSDKEKLSNFSQKDQDGHCNKKEKIPKQISENSERKRKRVSGSSPTTNSKKSKHPEENTKTDDGKLKTVHSKSHASIRDIDQESKTTIDSNEKEKMSVVNNVNEEEVKRPDDYESDQLITQSSSSKKKAAQRSNRSKSVDKKDYEQTKPKASTVKEHRRRKSSDQRTHSNSKTNTDTMCDKETSEDDHTLKRTETIIRSRGKEKHLGLETCKLAENQDDSIDTTPELSVESTESISIPSENLNTSVTASIDDSKGKKDRACLVTDLDNESKKIKADFKGPGICEKRSDKKKDTKTKAPQHAAQKSYETTHDQANRNSKVNKHKHSSNKSSSRKYKTENATSSSSKNECGSNLSEHSVRSINDDTNTAGADESKHKNQDTKSKNPLKTSKSDNDSSVNDNDSTTKTTNVDSKNSGSHKKHHRRSDVKQKTSESSSITESVCNEGSGDDVNKSTKRDTKKHSSHPHQHKKHDTKSENPEHCPSIAVSEEVAGRTKSTSKTKSSHKSSQSKHSEKGRTPGRSSKSDAETNSDNQVNSTGTNSEPDDSYKKIHRKLENSPSKHDKKNPILGRSSKSDTETYSDKPINSTSTSSESDDSFKKNHRKPENDSSQILSVSCENEDRKDKIPRSASKSQHKRHAKGGDSAAKKAENNSGSHEQFHKTGDKLDDTPKSVSTSQHITDQNNSTVKRKRKNGHSSTNKNTHQPDKTALSESIACHDKSEILDMKSSSSFQIKPNEDCEVVKDPTSDDEKAAKQTAGMKSNKKRKHSSGTHSNEKTVKAPRRDSTEKPSKKPEKNDESHSRERPGKVASNQNSSHSVSDDVNHFEKDDQNQDCNIDTSQDEVEGTLTIENVSSQEKNKTTKATYSDRCQTPEKRNAHTIPSHVDMSDNSAEIEEQHHVVIPQSCDQMDYSCESRDESEEEDMQKDESDKDATHLPIKDGGNHDKMNDQDETHLPIKDSDNHDRINDKDENAVDKRDAEGYVSDESGDEKYKDDTDEDCDNLTVGKTKYDSSQTEDSDSLKGNEEDESEPVVVSMESPEKGGGDRCSDGADDSHPQDICVNEFELLLHPEESNDFIFPSTASTDPTDFWDGDQPNMMSHSKTSIEDGEITSESENEQKDRTSHSSRRSDKSKRRSGRERSSERVKNRAVNSERKERDHRTTGDCHNIERGRARSPGRHARPRTPEAGRNRGRRRPDETRNRPRLDERNPEDRKRQTSAARDRSLDSGNARRSMNQRERDVLRDTRGDRRREPESRRLPVHQRLGNVNRVYEDNAHHGHHSDDDVSKRTSSRDVSSVRGNLSIRSYRDATNKQYASVRENSRSSSPHFKDKLGHQNFDKTNSEDSKIKSKSYRSSRHRDENSKDHKRTRSHSHSKSQ